MQAMQILLTGMIFLGGASLEYLTTSALEMDRLSIDPTERLTANEIHTTTDHSLGRTLSTLADWVTCKGSTLNTGEQLNQGECLCNNKDYYMCMDIDGLFGLINQINGEISGVRLSTKEGDYAKMETDGNLVVYKNSNRNKISVWESNTAGENNAKLELDKRGTATIESADKKIIWAQYQDGCKNARNSKRNVILRKGERLFPGQYICDGQYRFGMNWDGDLVLVNRIDDEDNDYDYYYYEDEELWKAETGAEGGMFLKMKMNGNLVVYNDDQKQVWSSGTKDVAVPPVTRSEGESEGTPLLQVRIRGGHVGVEVKGGAEVWKAGTPEKPAEIFFQDSYKTLSERIKKNLQDSLFKTTPAVCTRDGIKYDMGESFGHTRKKCISGTSNYIGESGICQPDGTFKNVDKEFSCGNLYCVQCADSALCLTTNTATNC